MMIYLQQYKIVIREVKLILVVRQIMDQLKLSLKEFYQMIKITISKIGPKYFLSIAMGLGIKVLGPSPFSIKELIFILEVKI